MKKYSIFLLLAIFCFQQTVFSHVLMMDDHDGEMAGQQITTASPCKKSDCAQHCISIEKSKLSTLLPQAPKKLNKTFLAVPYDTSLRGYDIFDLSYYKNNKYLHDNDPPYKKSPFLSLRIGPTLRLL